MLMENWRLANCRGAIEKYLQCVDQFPAFFDGWHALGMTLMKNGNYPQAIVKSR